MNEGQIRTAQQLIEHAYDAFNARDIDTVLKVFHPKVKWPRAWEGDYVHGHEEVRSYWQRQWKELDPTVTPISIRERENGTFEVIVDQLVRDLAGTIIFNGRVKHIYKIDDGLLRQMDIEMSK